MLHKEVENLLKELEIKSEQCDELELDLKFREFQNQGVVDGALLAQQAENAETRADQKKIVIERLEEKNQDFAVDLNGLRSQEQTKNQAISELERKVAKLELEKNRLTAQLQKKGQQSGLLTYLTPRAATNTSMDASQNQSLNFTSRSKSFANVVIHKLKRRVSFAGGNLNLNNSRPSFHMKSHANLSIYRVSEASNESPDKVSSGKVTRRKSLHVSAAGADQTSLGLGSTKRGRVSASFYFHANQLSAWQSNLSNNEEIEAPAEEDLKEVTLKIPQPRERGDKGLVNYRSQLQNTQSSISGIMIQRSSSILKTNEPLSTVQDEQGIYPYFKNPLHIRSLKSLNDENSQMGSSQKDCSRSIIRSCKNQASDTQLSPGKLIQSSTGRAQRHKQRRAYNNNSLSKNDPILFLEEISPHSLCSEAGDVSFESKGIEQDYDQICLKVHLHPLHHVIRSLLETHFKKNGGGTDQSVSKILQSKSTLAINCSLWKDK